MFRLALGIVCLVILTNPLHASAEEVEGIFVKYDKEKMLLTLKIEEKEQAFPVTEETKLFTLAGKPNKRGIGGLGSFKAERAFKLNIEKKGSKIVVLEIRPQK